MHHTALWDASKISALGQNPPSTPTRTTFNVWTQYFINFMLKLRHFKIKVLLDNQINPVLMEFACYPSSDFNIWHLSYKICLLTSAIFNLTYDIGYLTYDICLLIYDIWYLTCAIMNIMYDIWNMKYDKLQRTYYLAYMIPYLTYQIWIRFEVWQYTTASW